MERYLIQIIISPAWYHIFMHGYKVSLWVKWFSMQIFFSIFWWICFFIFFTGYPLAYGFFHLMGKSKNMHHLVVEKIYPMLPLAYALVSTCFWLLMIYTGKTGFIINKIASASPSVSIILYSFTALLFWLPAVRKKTHLSLLHALPFFLLPPLNMLLSISRHKVVPHDYISNLLRIYGAAFILYLLMILFLLLIKWIAGSSSFRHHNA